MSVATLLNSTCTIRRATDAVSSVSGATLPTWADAATLVPCDIQAKSGSESRINARETGETEWDVYFLPDTDVRAEDRINTILVGGSATSWSGRELTITSPPLDNAGRRSYTLVTAAERKGGGLP